MTAIYLLATLIISGTMFFNRNRIFNYFLVIAFLLLQWILTIYEYTYRNIEEFYGLFKPDSLALLMLITLSIIAIPAYFHSYIYFHKNREIPKERGIYFAAITMLIAAMTGAYLSNHISVTWIFAELTTLAASALIYHRRNTRSLEGTWKYVFVCSISITLVFIGILFLSIALQQVGSSDLSFPTLLENAKTLNIFWLQFAFIFIFTGYTVKLGLVPMYTAGIDAKDKAPSPAGALLSSVLMNMGFVGIFRFYEIIAQTSIHVWANHIITIAALLSIFVATVYMLKVKNIKRMLAYSSIEHAGIAMLGIAAGGIGYYAAVLHLILHAFTKSVMFFQTGQIFRIYNSKNMYDVGNYFKYNITGAMIMFIALIWITALPPSGLFVSELLIFRSLFETHYFFVLSIVLILLTFIIWALVKNIFKLLFIPPVAFQEERIEKISAYESIFQFILLGLVVYLGWNPPETFVELINEAVKNLLH